MIHDRAHGWLEVLDDLLWRPGGVRPHFQPVVDLHRGEVCGYEALARFTEFRDLRPGDVFAAAERHGLGGALEATMVREVLAAVPHLPANRFVSVNASPRALVADEVRTAFAEADRLDGVIVEVTEQTDAQLEALNGVLAELRARGALIAVDDVGTRSWSLTRITTLRPQFVKIDRALVANVDTHPAKAAVIETLVGLAARLDAWLVAEGVERLEEIEALTRLRVPLAQGYAFGTPGPGMAELDPELAGHIRTRLRPAGVEAPISALVEAVPTLPEPASDRALGALFGRLPGPDIVALVDDQGRPTGIVRRDDHARGDGPVRNLMLVTTDMPIAAVGRRAMSRPPLRRFDPVVCWDESGRYTGVVRIERVVEALAQAA